MTTTDSSAPHTPRSPFDILLRRRFIRLTHPPLRRACHPLHKLIQLPPHRSHRLRVHVGVTHVLGDLDQQAQQMLCAIAIADALAVPLVALVRGGLPPRGHVGVLLALELVQQGLAEGALEPLLEAEAQLLEQLGLGAAEPATALFVLEVLVEDPVDGVLGGEGHELVVFGHEFPVVDQVALDRVGDVEVDLRLGHEVVFEFDLVVFFLAARFVVRRRGGGAVVAVAIFAFGREFAGVVVAGRRGCRFGGVGPEQVFFEVRG